MRFIPGLPIFNRDIADLRSGKAAERAYFLFGRNAIFTLLDLSVTDVK